MELFLTFPREVGNPFRTLVTNRDDFFNYIKQNLPFFNLYSTVYSFRKVEKVGNKLKPVYQTAIVDKIWLDLDGDKSYDYAIRIHEWLDEKHIYHMVIFSGGGFHIYIWVKPLIEYSGDEKRKFITAFCNYIESKLDVVIDPITIGDLARMARIPNTYNFKRKKWCIPVNEKMLYSKPLIEIMANRPQDTFEIFGSKYADISKIPKNYYQVVFSKSVSTSDVDVDSYLNSIDWEEEVKIPIYLPPFIKKIIAKHKLGWDKATGYWDRYLLILWFRESGLTLKQTLQALKSILTPGEFKHSVQEEKQPFYIYRRASGPNALLFPTPEWLMSHGYDLTKEDIDAINSLYSIPSYVRV